MNGMFTDRVKKVMELARSEAVRLDNNHVGTEHLLLGLIREGDGVAVEVLKNLGIDLTELAEGIGVFASSLGNLSQFGRMIAFTSKAKKSLEFAAEEARGLKHTYIGTEHLLLALIRFSECSASKALAGIGVEYAKVKNEIEKVLCMTDTPATQLGTRGYDNPRKAHTMKLVVSTMNIQSLNSQNEELFDIAKEFNVKKTIEAGDGDFNHPVAIRVFPNYPTGGKECNTSAIITKHGVDILPFGKGEKWRGVRFEIVFLSGRKVSLTLKG